MGARGQPVSAETRAKISAALRKSHPFKGKRLSPEWRAKVIRTLQPKHNEVATSKFKAWRQSQVLPYRDTKPERVVQARVAALGLDFQTHRPIRGLNHQWDIMIPSLHLLIEVDGCYWHGCSRCGHGSRSTSERDSRLDAIARAAGWCVIRVWGHDAETV